MKCLVHTCNWKHISYFSRHISFVIYVRWLNYYIIFQSVCIMCLERVVAIYSLNVNDQGAKCYVACMLLKFNVVRSIIIQKFILHYYYLYFYYIYVVNINFTKVLNFKIFFSSYFLENLFKFSFAISHLWVWLYFN